MIQVEQSILGGDSSMPGVRGDCLRACVASIFELPLEAVPHFVGEDDWWNAWREWTEARGFLLGSAFQSFEGDDRTKLNGHPTDGIYWIATVKSPRIVRDDGEPGLHSIVMCGGEVAWDPHPQREMGHLGFVGLGYQFIAPDPSRFALRDALPERPDRIDEPLPEELERLLRDPEIAIPMDYNVHFWLADYLRRNPDVETVSAGAYRNLWALYEREGRAA